jgi:hypothetical protein
MHFFNPVARFLYKAKDLSAPSRFSPIAFRHFFRNKQALKKVTTGTNTGS